MQNNELFDLSSQVAVVTGAGRGIGEGIARALANAGAAVVVAARRKHEIDAVAQAINDSGGRAVAQPTDVTERDQLEALAARAVDEFGSLTIWVNNAGGSPVVTPLKELSRTEWDATMALNLTAPWEATAIAAGRIETGTIINISSPAATRALPGSGHYSAAKAGLNMLTETFSKELAPNIRVNGIAPGIIPTEIVQQALGMDEEQIQGLAAIVPLGRLGSPEDIGACCVYMASPAGSWVSGQTLEVHGGS